MTTTEAAPADVTEQIETFAESLFDAALGAAELTIAWLGRSLGLYAALRGAGALTAAEVAARAGVDERYTREWLEHQAVARVLAVDDPGLAAADRRYTLPEAHAIALLYGFSILHCLPVGRDAESSAAMGTVMRPDVFTRYAREAGFSQVEILPIEHPFFRFYRPVG